MAIKCTFCHMVAADCKARQVGGERPCCEDCSHGLFKLGDWGDRLHEAYREFRDATGLTWKDHALRVSESLGYECDEMMLIRLTEEERRPFRYPYRQRARAFVISIGQDPDEWGLSAEDDPP